MKCMNCGKEIMHFMTKDKIPAWAKICAIIFFPLGLFCLTARKKEHYFICDECGYTYEQ